MVRYNRALILVSVIILTLWTAGCAKKPAQDTKTADLGLAVVDMAKAVEAHPNNKDLLALKRQYNTLADQLEVEAAMANKSKAAALKSPMNGDGLNAALNEEFKTRMAAKQAELDNNLKAEAEKVRQELAAELDAYAQEVDQTYLPQIFSLQLKIKTVALTKEELAALQAELGNLQKERDDKITAKRQELSARMDAVMGPKQTAAEQQLASYAQALNEELSRKASSKEAEIASRVSQAEMPGEGSDRQAELNRQLALKQQEIGRLEQRIVEDIRSKAAQIASARGYHTVITGVKVNVNAADITQDIINLLTGRN